MPNRRTFLIGLLGALGAGTAFAQNAGPAAPRAAAPSPRRNPEQRRQQRQTAKTVMVPEPRGQPAPIPNRDIEAPRDTTTSQRAQLSPTVIDPAPAQPHLRGSGFAMQAQEDRLLQRPMPGARLSVPFSY